MSASALATAQRPEDLKSQFYFDPAMRLAQYPCCLLHKGGSKALNMRKHVAIKNAAFPDRSLVLSSYDDTSPTGLETPAGKAETAFFRYAVTAC